MKSTTPSIEPLESRIAPAFAGVFELSDINGANGFRIDGAAAFDFAGGSVSDAGDINGDGFADVIFSASGADPNGDGTGASYVVFGKPIGFLATSSVSSLNGLNGFRISGPAGGHLGYSVSAAGDVNGDGLDDIIIGARLPSGPGAAYVILGRTTAFPANLDPSKLNGNDGFIISGTVFNDRVGSAVSGAGDVNGDGFDDLFVSAPGVSPNGAGFVIFGKAGGFTPNLLVSSINGSNGFKVTGVPGADAIFETLSGAGDLNGDGYADLIVGAPGADFNGTASGSSYVIFGKASGFGANLNLSTLNGSNGFRVDGNAGDNSGLRVSEAGDVNADGLDDLIIGASSANVTSGTGAGASYVLFGKAGGFASSFNLSSLTGANGFKVAGVAAGDYAGNEVSGAGDVNGDGFDDVIISAPGADPHGDFSNASYVLFGKASGFSANVYLSSLNGVDGFTLNGVAQHSYGSSVSGAGDVNGDGFDDFIIGANNVVPVRNAAGATYIVFGRGIAQLDISDAVPGNEGSAGSSSLQQFTVSLSEAALTPVTVKLATSSGTALAGADFSYSGPATLTFAPGEISKTVSVTLIGDSLFEADETFSLLLSDATGVSIRNGVGIGTIRNDDAPPVISIADALVIEGDSDTANLLFTVSLSQASGLPVTVNFSSADGTALAGSDYTELTPGTLTFASGEMTKTVAVEVLADTSIEDYERFSLVISQPLGATLGKEMAFGTIQNDDTAIRIGNAEGILESNTPAVFNVSLEKPSALPVSVSYTTIDGTATGGSDFAVGEGVVVFAPGETSKTITVAVLGDMDVETHEVFSVGLANPSNATLATDLGTATILNDDTHMSISGGSVLEGHAGTHSITFTVILSAETALPVSVNFSALDGTATAGADYTGITDGTLQFAPGETSKVVTVDVLGDTAVESSETFSVSLSGAMNATVDNSLALGIIENDDLKLISSRVATFTDVDGDLVFIRVSKGALKVEDFILFPSGIGSHLALIDFSGDTQFSNAVLSITAKKDPATGHGDGRVDVSAIFATGIDLARVSIKGDLGQIDVGSGGSDTTALRSLSATSLGVDGLAVPFALSPLQSAINGSLKKLTLLGGMRETELSVTGDITSIAIDGDLIESAIRSDSRIGSIKVGGDVAGTGQNHAIISALGLMAPVSDAKALAIGSIAIGGSVDHAEIRAGYNRFGAGVNADVQVGKITVSGDWQASSVVAGAMAGDDGAYGTGDDILIPGGDSIVASIASILIKGLATGSDVLDEHYGFVAEELGKLRFGEIKPPLQSGPANDLLAVTIGTAGNLTAREVA